MRRAAVEPYDAAIVLGAKIAADGSPSPAMARRVAHGAALVRSGHARTLLMSGGATTHAVAEAHVMRGLALAHGVPEAALHIEDRSRNTIENALLSAPIAAAFGWRRLVVVSDAYHLPRALYIFRRFGLNAAGSAASLPDRPGKEWWLAHLREAGAFAWTVIRVERRLLLKD